MKMYDETLFAKAKGVADVIITKDVDLVNIVKRIGPPPSILWLRIGNTSNAHLKRIFAERLPEALRMLGEGEPLVEIAD